MSTITIKGLLGENDSCKTDYEDTFSFDLFSDRDGQKSNIIFYLDKLNKMNLLPREIGVDLLILGAHVFTADRRIERKCFSQDGWTRKIRIIVPVFETEIWVNSRELIENMLKFLTGDIWQVEFRPRTQNIEMLVEKPNLANKISFDQISLFSGGLDSLIGAIDSVCNGKSQLLVSHADDSLVVTAQNACFNVINSSKINKDIVQLRPWRFNVGDLIGKNHREYTSRGRSFLFFSLAVAISTALENEEFMVNVPENGFISLNIPLDPLRIGSLSTRTTHPFFIARWNELIKNLELKGSLENPYWDQTKRQMVDNCLDSKLLGRAIEFSVSCSSPRQGRYDEKSPGHCGKCVPCLIRRSALLNHHDPTNYLFDILEHEVLNTKKPEAVGTHVRSFQVAIDRIQKNKKYADILIHQSGSLKDFPNRLKKYAKVYRRGLIEMHELLENVRTSPL